MEQRNESDSSPPTAGEQLISFPFTGEVTEPSFEASLRTWARSEAFPAQGPQGVAILSQIKGIREALDLMEARFRESLAADSDALPGWGLSPGAMVRETFRVTALKVLQQLQKTPGNQLKASDVLACSRLNLGELTERLSLLSGTELAIAADWLHLALDDLFSVRQNRPSLRKLNAEEAFSQRERLEGSDQ